MRYAIIGAGPAGVLAAETLRSADPEAEVALIGDEPEPAYSRMAIPYYLANQIEESGTYLRPAQDHFANLGIGSIRDRVTAVDAARCTLTLANGAPMGFDRLLVATGSRPLKPPVEGLDQDGVHHCWTLEDARQIARYAQPGSRVTLVGAGFIGCIILEALARRGVKLTVVEMGDRMVPRMMDQEAGGLIKKWCIAKGVDVRTSTRISAVNKSTAADARFEVVCEGSGPIPADLIVIATGVQPCIDFLKGSGIQTARGVIVDQYLQSSVPEVYAAGDACEGFDWNTGDRAIHAIQPVAAETGRMAALNMTGDRVPYGGGLAMNVLDTLGLIALSFGQWMGVTDGESCRLLDEGRFRYISLQFRDDRLIGVIALGATEHVGVLRGLIQSRTRLGRWKSRLMADPSRFMEAYLALVQPV